MTPLLRNTHRFVALSLAIGILALSSLAHADTMPPVSGVISIATEPVTIKTTSVEGKASNRTVGVGQPIYLNDEIKTGPSNKLQILLKDQTVFNIGPNSVMTIDKFVFDPTKGELSVGIQKGAFKFVSGKTANSNPDAMKVKLPNATISVRGTGVAGSVAPDGASTVVLLHGTVDVAGTAGTSTLSKSGWGVQVGPSGQVGQPTVIPPEVTKGIMGSVAQIKAPAVATPSNKAPQAADSGNTNQIPSSITATNTNGNTSDSSGSVANTSGLSAATLSAIKSTLSSNSAAALNSANLNLLHANQNDYIDRLSTSFCAVCPDLSNTLGFTDTYYSLSDLKGATLTALGPLGTVTFTNTAGNGAGPDVFGLTQTLTIDYAGGTLRNQYSFATNTSPKSGGWSYSGNQSTTFSQLVLSAADPHFFILPTNPTQTNLQMTAALGNSTQSGVSAGKVASLGYVINSPTTGNAYSAISRVVGH